MNSNQVQLVGENVAQTDIYISYIITTLMTEACDLILMRRYTLRFQRITSTSVCTSPTPHPPLSPPSKQNNCVHPLTFIIGAEELLVAWHWLPDGKQKPPPSWIDVWVSFCQTVQCKTYAGILHSSAAFDYLLNVIIMWKQQICAPTQNLGLGPFIKNKKMLFMTPHKTWPWSEASCSLVAHPPVRSRWKYYIKYIYIDHLFFNCACLSLE